MHNRNWLRCSRSQIYGVAKLHVMWPLPRHARPNRVGTISKQVSDVISAVISDDLLWCSRYAGSQSSNMTRFFSSDVTLSLRLQRMCTGFTIITMNVGRYLEKGVEGILYVSDVSFLILLLSTSFSLQALKKQSFGKFNHSVTHQLCRLCFQCLLWNSRLCLVHWRI